MSTAVVHQFQITTHADTRSGTRRHRTWTVAAVDAAEAEAVATENHLRVVGWNSGISCRFEAVDGRPVADCPHVGAPNFPPFEYRWDGGRDCPDCAEAAS